MFNTLRGSSVAALLLATGVQGIEQEVCDWLVATRALELDNPWDSIKDKKEVKDENFTQFDFYYAFGTCWNDYYGGEAIGGEGPTFGEVCGFLKDNVNWDSEDPYASAKENEDLKDLNEQQFYGFATSCYDAFDG